MIKAGLEIHQQLDTNKLFCNCPSILRNDSPTFSVKRKLHAVAGETGEVDIAAKHEASLDKEFIYEGYDSTCLVELDEEPPHLINQEALEIALHVSLLLNCEILQISQIMRKTVIDGSNTSGFQRTVLIARNGFIETKSGKVRIDNVSLEEDSARTVSEDKGKKTFRLDRLGIPLIEIGTSADITTAEQAKEVALQLGDILRSCKVKRGIGTIRQDINISIPGHDRIEIKGFQDVKTFIPTIEKEIKRQQDNIKKKKITSEVRKANEDGSTTFLRPMPGSARMYPETDLPLLRISKDIINNAKKTLPKLRTEINESLIKIGLSSEMIKLLLSSGMLEEFEQLLKIVNDPDFIVKSLILFPRELISKNKKAEQLLTSDIIEEIIKAVKSNKIKKADTKHVMQQIVEGKTLDQALKIEKVDLTNIESEIIKLVKEKPNLSIGAYMGLIMSKFKGKISGQEANEILNKILKN